MAMQREDLFTGFEHQGQHMGRVDLRACLGSDWDKFPMVLRLLTENVARCAPEEDLESMLASLAGWGERRTSQAEISFSPARLLMHDTTSTPALVDLAAMRDRIASAGGDPSSLAPSIPVEVSVDHSLAVESFAHQGAAEVNIGHDIRRNQERYRFLKWASSQMSTLHINPPGTGIMHTINLEQLATLADTGVSAQGQSIVYPDMMLGTDSHTPMINGLGVLGWGIGGLEAETVIFGMSTSLQIPDVIGVHLTGELQAGAMATDLALVVTHRLRALGVTGEFVEFYGQGLDSLSVGERAVIANMAPEYGATTGYFPVDEHALTYFEQTGRSAAQIDLVSCYYRESGLWRVAEPCEKDLRFTRTIEIDLSTIRPSAAGPKRPQDLVSLEDIPNTLENYPPSSPGPESQGGSDAEVPAHPVALASITSCTNTTDPRLLIAAGLLARKARRLGLKPKSWVKTSLAPGSPAAASYLNRAGLTEDLSALGFDIVGFGCATCIGNSGALTPQIEQWRSSGQIRPAAVLSGNRNFPGRVHPDLDIGFLTSPPLVIAYSLTGDADTNLITEPVTLHEGEPVWLEELWPSAQEVDQLLHAALNPEDFTRDFQHASRNLLWDALEVPDSPQFPWVSESTILRPPPFAYESARDLPESLVAHPLLVLGDDVTTDHISPASAIPKDSFIADYLVNQGEDRDDLNVFASRRGNWEVMGRGAFYNHSLTNNLLPHGPTAHTTHGPTGTSGPLWDVAAQYREQDTPVVLIAGERFGMGSSRDWAAKAQKILGIRAVIARSFERIHRTNLIGMGILPLERLTPDRDGLDEITADTQLVFRPADLVNAAPSIPAFVDVVTPGEGRRQVSVRLAAQTSNDRALLKHGGVIPALMQTHSPTSVRPSL